MYFGKIETSKQHICHFILYVYMEHKNGKHKTKKVIFISFLFCDLFFITEYIPSLRLEWYGRYINHAIYLQSTDLLYLHMYIVHTYYVASTSLYSDSVTV
jgi:hypothetical protein